MNYKEICGDLFDHAHGRYIVHCVSADFTMGAGIAKAISYRYGFTAADVPDEIKESCVQVTRGKRGTLYQYGKILNLVTKEKHWHKPTYFTLECSLRELKEFCLSQQITALAMPRIGCGLDRLYWPTVRSVLLDIFADTDMDILVCYL